MNQTFAWLINFDPVRKDRGFSHTCVSWQMFLQVTHLKLLMCWVVNAQDGRGLWCIAYRNPQKALEAVEGHRNPLVAAAVASGHKANYTLHQLMSYVNVFTHLIVVERPTPPPSWTPSLATPQALFRFVLVRDAGAIFCGGPGSDAGPHGALLLTIINLDVIWPTVVLYAIGR